MFNLIISIVAIALVVALAGASFYYGGSIFSNGKAGAFFAQISNQTNQISSAVEIYKVTNISFPASQSDLVAGGQLSSVISPPYYENISLPLRKYLVKNINNKNYVFARYKIGEKSGVRVGAHWKTLSLELCNKIREEDSDLRCVASTGVADVNSNGFIDIDDRYMENIQPAMNEFTTILKPF